MVPACRHAERGRVAALVTSCTTGCAAPALQIRQWHGGTWLGGFDGQ